MNLYYEIIRLHVDSNFTLFVAAKFSLFTDKNENILCSAPCWPKGKQLSSLLQQLSNCYLYNILACSAVVYVRGHYSYVQFA